MKKYYVEQAIMGKSNTVFIEFDTKEESEQYLKDTDYCNKSAKKYVDFDRCYNVEEYKMYY